MEGFCNRPPRSIVRSVSAICVLVLTGCNSVAPAPMTVWNPPQIQTVRGKTIALAKIAAIDDQGESFEKAFVANAPNDPIHPFRLLDQNDLQKYSTIQLASASDSGPSDLALVNAARKQGVDLVMSGTILPQRGSRKKQAAAFTVSWQLLDVSGNQLVGGLPITVTAEKLEHSYPQLAAREDRQSALIEAAARESWNVLLPHLSVLTTALAEPHWMLGAKRVRQGNARAAAGNWAEAEQIWQSVATQYPSQHAAVHNLALAAAAKGDFQRAKELSRQALRAHDSAMYRRTGVWIEKRQMDWIEAFNQPVPTEGWLFAPDETTPPQ
jgi:tetratricopeptide (TPR) repeat protein